MHSNAAVPQYRGRRGIASICSIRHRCFAACSLPPAGGALSCLSLSALPRPNSNLWQRRCIDFIFQLILIKLLIIRTRRGQRGCLSQGLHVYHVSPAALWKEIQRQANRLHPLRLGTIAASCSAPWAV
ncbi:uncharacterized protein LOC122999389 isoform X6 [Thunnus albacares]|uniref:uncharacterized protein LOC122999389 isoform X6 n=1 Tax=Thunnus albacares TaxID=8236 RepID=UPI001CF69BFC|nr:uncharacterized protein LOC122999389 isoform X6 [Thunnus albacares]